MPHILLYRENEVMDISMDPAISPPYPYEQWTAPGLIHFSGMEWKNGVLTCGGDVSWNGASTNECSHTSFGSTTSTPYPPLNVAGGKAASAIVHGRLWITGGRQLLPSPGTHVCSLA